MNELFATFIDKFKLAAGKNLSNGRRIGSELKFPIVNPDGSAASRDKVDKLWEYLCNKGWQPQIDQLSGNIVGATCAGHYNETAASCETGYCKTEFSMAHVGNLHELAEDVTDLRTLLKPFCEKHEVLLLGYGIHPVTPPGKHLLMKKARAGVWDKIFPSNRYIAKEDGDDFHLFTVNAASHVHVNVAPQEAIDAVNVLNGFSGAQIALTANSCVWKGASDDSFQCVSEMFWDQWMEDSSRVGIPNAPFNDLNDYLRTIAEFKPVFVMREDMPVMLPDYDTFMEYFTDNAPIGKTMQGNTVHLTPQYEDFDLHCTCYWYNARISRYFTVENRISDQQPPEDMLSIPALTLGLVTALEEGAEEISAYDWDALRQARVHACRHGLVQSPRSDSHVDLMALAKTMLDIASLGLKKRGLDEEQYLEPLQYRLATCQCPAHEMRRRFEDEGMPGLIERCRL